MDISDPTIVTFINFFPASVMFCPVFFLYVLNQIPIQLRNSTVLYPPVVASLRDELLELSQGDPLPRDGDAIWDRLTAEVVANHRHVTPLLALSPPDDDTMTHVK